MNYLSVCSGIGGDHVAWAPLGWECLGFAEIDPQASAVLAHRFPDVPNFGDFTTITGDEFDGRTVDLVCGGTPCQSFSIAGLRGGMDDDRGNLALEFCRLVDRIGPTWVVWENVPGVLSSDGGRDFGSIVGALVELGFCVAWRILDAQYVRVESHPRAVPQRRRRVFLVGYSRDWRPPVAVLFEPEGMRRHPAPRREAGKGVAGTIASRASVGGGLGTGVVAAYRGNRTSGSRDVAAGLNAHGGPHGRCDFESETFICHDRAPSLTAHHAPGDRESTEGLLVSHSLTAEGHDASEDGTGRGTPLVGFTAGHDGSDASEDVAPTVSAGGRDDQSRGCGKSPAVAFSCKDSGQDLSEDVSPTLRAMADDGANPNGGGQVAVAFDARQNNVLIYGDKSGPVDTDPHMIGVVHAFQEGQAGDVKWCGDDRAITNSICRQGGKAGQGYQAVAVSLRGRKEGNVPEVMEGGAAPTIRQGEGGSGNPLVMQECPDVVPTIPSSGPPYSRTGNSFVESDALVSVPTMVRRVTPLEAERLQGFPDGWTLVPWKGKPMADGPRYRMLGNAWAVNVARWVGERIQMFEDLTR